MLKYLIKGMVSALAVKLLENCRQWSIQLLKIEAAKSYLHAVRLARLSALGLMRMLLVIGLIGVGVVLLHVGLFILLPWTVEAKAILGMGLGLAYVTIGVVVLRAAMDEKTWMEKSGADEMVEDATGQSGKG